MKEQEEYQVNFKRGVFIEPQFYETFRNVDGSHTAHFGTIEQITKARDKEVEEKMEVWQSNLEQDMETRIKYEIEWSRINNSKPISLWTSMAISAIIVLILLLLL